MLGYGSSKNSGECQLSSPLLDMHRIPYQRPGNDANYLGWSLAGWGAAGSG